MKKELEDHKYTWGDAVVIKKETPSSFHPGEYASVCGMTKIISNVGAEEFQCNIGDWVYLVEFEDGSDIEIAERYLKKYDEETEPTK